MATNRRLYSYDQLAPNSNLEKRFWGHVDKSPLNGCWEWTAATNSGGYGRFDLKDERGKYRAPAHAVSFLLRYKTDISGYDIDHICENRKCVNPDHLRLSSRSENIRNKKPVPGSTSKYRGVSWAKDRNKWRATARVGRKSFSLGRFSNEEDAHSAVCKFWNQIGEYRHVDIATRI